ncbi:hypothetical protein AZE42_13328 [Rhizopogon vesiculosus]|uniref:DNA-directed RNA polymerase n=1 Tax=Rhizopogon vesiculosus TaxID=180088 RepID=A0A1J8QQB1_9AGAM|nr:hypothetical protein AZE42_13328 [Rhizopogon vesiculosus]
MVIPRSINIQRAPDPKSSNPVFDDVMLIKNGEIIFGIVEKKTVGALQGGLMHVVFCKKGLEATHDQIIATFLSLFVYECKYSALEEKN